MYFWVTIWKYSHVGQMYTDSLVLEALKLCLSFNNKLIKYKLFKDSRRNNKYLRYRELLSL